MVSSRLLSAAPEVELELNVSSATQPRQTSTASCHVQHKYGASYCMRHPDRYATRDHTSIINQPTCGVDPSDTFVAGIASPLGEFHLDAKVFPRQESLVREAHLHDAITPAPGGQGRRPHAPSVFWGQTFKAMLNSPSGRRLPQPNKLHTAACTRMCTTGQLHCTKGTAFGTLRRAPWAGKLEAACTTARMSFSALDFGMTSWMNSPVSTAHVV